MTPSPKPQNRHQRRVHAVTVQRKCKHEFVWQALSGHALCEKCHKWFTMNDKWGGYTMRLPDGSYLA